MPAPGAIAAAQHVECKTRMTHLAAAVPNTTLIDFMFRSPITQEDENYWDPEHYHVGIATLIGESVVDAIKPGGEREGVNRILLRPGG